MRLINILAVVAITLCGAACGETRSSSDGGDSSVPASDGGLRDGNGVFDVGSDAGDSGSETRIVELEVAFSHACVLFEDGHFDCWSTNDYDVAELFELDYGVRFRSFSSGGGVCGIEFDGSVNCFNLDVSGLRGAYDQVALGTDNVVCGLRPNGEVDCVPGPNIDGAGDWVETTEFSGSFSDFTIGRRWACGLRASGEADCSEHPFSETAGLSGPEGSYSRIEMGHNLACGLRSEGGVDCWGLFVDISSRGYPTSGDFMSLSFDGVSGCVLNSAGHPSCWGPGVEDPPPNIPFKLVDPSFRVTCGVTLDDKILCWGSKGAELNAVLPPEIAYQPEP